MRLFLFPFFFSFVSSSLFGKRLVIQTRNSPWIFLRGNGDYRAEANNFGGEGRGGGEGRHESQFRACSLRAS